MPDVPAARILHHDREHRGMKMKMEVAVDMVQRKTGCVEFLELRRDFPGQLLATAWIEEKSEAGGNGAVREPLLRVDQIWNVAVGQGGVPTDQRQVQANPEPGMVARQLHGFVEAFFVDH